MTDREASTDPNAPASGPVRITIHPTATAEETAAVVAVITQIRADAARAAAAAAAASPPAAATLSGWQRAARAEALRPLAPPPPA